MKNHSIKVFLVIVSLLMMMIPLSSIEMSNISSVSPGIQIQDNNHNGNVIPSISGNYFSAVMKTVSSVYEGQHFSIFINATKGYSNYTATLYLGAEYDKGMSPLNSTREHSTKGSFQFRITAPEADNQSIYGSVYLTANFEGTPVNYSLNFNIQVYAPIELYAEIYNSNYVPYYNVSVEFVLNGVGIGTKTIAKLDPYSKDKINITIQSSEIDPGKVNTISVKVLNSKVYSGVSAQYSSRFFYGKPPNYNWIYYISGVVVIFMAFLVLSSGRGRGTKQPKWRTRREKPKKLSKK
ncbi:MAG: hypothetical protein ACYCSO_05905 [Cuniculiplasma sp.]